MTQFLVNLCGRSAGSAGEQGCNNIATLTHRPSGRRRSSTTSPWWTQPSPSAEDRYLACRPFITSIFKARSGSTATQTFFKPATSPLGRERQSPSE
jgi:hypothetical protein